MNKKSSPEKLSQQVWLRWQHAGDLIAKYLERSFTKGKGLSYEKFMVLLSIAVSDKDVTATSLSEQLGRNPNTLSTMLDRMEKAGLVNKVRDVVDRRKIWVTVTDKGARRFSDSVKAGTGVLEELSGRFSADELAVMNRLVDKLQKILEQELFPKKGKKKGRGRRRAYK